MDISGFAYHEIQFDRDANLVEPGASAALSADLATAPSPDVLFMCHGWNNDMAEARELYRAWARGLRSTLGRDIPPHEQPSLVGVFWPSKKLADRDLIPGGAASADLGAPVQEAERLRAELRDLRGSFDAPDADILLEQAIAAASSLEGDATEQRRFVEAMEGLAQPLAGETLDDPEEPSIGDALWEQEPSQLLARAADQVSAPSHGRGGAASTVGGGAAGLFDLPGSLTQGARRLLNLVTYYQMKKRAGTVGRAGLEPLLRRLRADSDRLRIHLVGHSFGGRLVTAAAAASDVGSIESMTLLQAAFSHYGFASKYRGGDQDGRFRGVLSDGKVKGPIVVTYTTNDRAVGFAYPIASRVAGQVGAALGDRNDPYGGIGRNGAVDTPEAIDGGMLLEVGGSYRFNRENGPRIHNLDAGRFIRDHGDVSGQQVAHVVLEAMRCRS